MEETPLFLNVSKAEEGSVETDSRVAFQVFFGIIFGMCILTSLCVITLPVVLRRLKSPFFILLASWSLANLLFSVVEATAHFGPVYKWTLGAFWCRGYFYLRFSLVFTRPYLMVVTAIFTVIGNKRFQRWTKRYVWLGFLVPFLVSTFVWTLIFLPCIWFWFEAKLVALPPLCRLKSKPKELPLIYLLLGYISPVVLTFILLLIWACLSHRAKTSDPIEKVQATILFLLVHAYILTQAVNVIVELVSTLRPILNIKYALTLYQAGLYTSIADLAISPSLCLLVALICRRQLLQSREVEEVKDGAEEMIEIKYLQQEQ